ncbi:MAG: Na(+)-translocating NADH-quinone reductase subunit C [Leptospiraceae bacterium]|nr:Na(+)-translocating NADH-quinone reductase subunit C [Leptospiraceae bacterium]MCB1199081.1 Na(+)-translocating NADH-quinone reductase subunit C [Leptospiraceae bacterium]
MASHDSVKKTLLVAFLLCVIFSVVVSAAAVALSKPQAINKELDRQKNILVAADLYKPGIDINKTFETIETRAINIKTGEVVSDFNVKTYDDRKAAKSPGKNIELDPKVDTGDIKRVASVYVIYLIKNTAGELDQIVLPIFGKGLWSTMYGFISLDKDLKTVRGITFYEHGETPGLGGEIENPRWQKIWQGKKAFAENGEMQLRVIKGEVNNESANAKHQIDGLAGATITSRGVSGTIEFWLGEQGFGKYLNTLRSELGLKAETSTKGENNG